jgi:starch synthase
MAKPLSILYVASEVYPFVKVGGIADVAYSLPLAIRELGHDIRVMVPKYGNVSERKNRIHEINRLKDVPIPIGDKTDPATVKSSSVFNPRNKVQAYITTNHRFFDAKKGIYTDPKTDKEYKDNDERFIYFNRTVIETCLLLGWVPDIIHCNDWQTGIVPAFVKIMFPHKFKKTKIVFTIHDFYQQGVYTHHSFDKTNLPKEIRQDFIHKSNFNFLKGGLMYSDRITTVSPSYAAEILKDKSQSNGLNALLIEKSENFTGILNGVDPYQWNPKNDANIKTKFTGDKAAFKLANKKYLLQKFKLEFHEDIPVIAMISRLTHKKGIPLFIESLEKILAENVQVVFLGDGDSDMKNALREIAKEFPNKFGLKIVFDEALAHQIEAGADMFINTSIYEPCGLNIIYSLLYGTVPIVRATGGLKDIVFDYDPKTKTGNGFLYRNLNVTELYNAVKKALDLFKKKSVWASIVENGMKSDFSWKAKKFTDIYYSALKEL